MQCHYFLEIFSLRWIIFLQVKLVETGFYNGRIIRGWHAFFLRLLLSFEVFEVKQLLLVEVSNL